MSGASTLNHQVMKPGRESLPARRVRECGYPTRRGYASAFESARQREVDGEFGRGHRGRARMLKLLYGNEINDFKSEPESARYCQ